MAFLLEEKPSYNCTVRLDKDGKITILDNGKILAGNLVNSVNGDIKKW